MGTLTASQRRFLRSAGQKLQVTCIVGKAGVTDAVARSVSAQLAKRELVKVRMPAGPADQKERLANQLAGATDAACVAVLGRTVLLYRHADTLSGEEKIPLQR